MFFLVSLFGFLSSGFSQTVQLSYSKDITSAEFAAKKIKASLSKNGYTIVDGKADFEISFTINADKQGSEAFSVVPSGKQIAITGGDERGLVYGSLSLAEAIQNGVPLNKIGATAEQPNYTLRAVKFDLPWDTYRHSHALDLHMETCKDLNYWKAFLDMMAENSLNSL